MKNNMLGDDYYLCSDVILIWTKTVRNYIRQSWYMVFLLQKICRMKTFCTIISLCLANQGESTEIQKKADPTRLGITQILR